MKHKGWFKIEGAHDGDRTLREQLIGLEYLSDKVAGKSILDLGCAEGLIARHFVKECGAARALGLTSVQTQVDSGTKQCAGLPIEIRRADLNDVRNIDNLSGRFDVVLMLSILHKLHYPGPFLLRALPVCADVVVIRLPSPIIDDARSKYVKCDHRPIMAKEFDLIDEPRGPRKEYCSIWKRRYAFV